MYRIVCTLKEASCIRGNFFGELCPTCEECRARCDDKLALKTARELLVKMKPFVKKQLHLDLNNKTKIFNMRKGVNAYSYKIKATHLEFRTESKRREKRRVKAMIAKHREGKKTQQEI